MISSVVEKTCHKNSRAHNLLVDLQNLDAEIVTLLNIIDDARNREQDDLAVDTMGDLVKFLEEKHRFLETMIRRLIVVAAPVIKESYDWQFRFTLDAVNDITSGNNAG